MKVSIEKMEKLIEKYALKASLKRDVSFLSHSIFSEAYVKGLKFLADFNYSAIGGIWTGGVYQSMSNDQDIAEKFDLLLSDKNKLQQVRKMAVGQFKYNKEHFKIVERDFLKSPIETMIRVVKIDLDYFPALGFYNAFMRAIGNKNFKTLGISKKIFEDIGKERNEVAMLYNEIENFFKRSCLLLGKIINIDGELLRFMSKTEILDVLNKLKVSDTLLQTAKQRKKQFFCIFTEEKGISEYIISSPKSVGYIYKKYFNVKTAKDIKGLGTFPGIVKGVVKVISSNVDENKVDIKKGNILVAVHTHPRYTPLVKQSSAIITDEGGILSHAAILSREMEIPCIVGTKFATKVLKDGDLVEVDANTGVVKIFKN